MASDTGSRECESPVTGVCWERRSTGSEVGATAGVREEGGTEGGGTEGGGTEGSGTEGGGTEAAVRRAGRRGGGGRWGFRSGRMVTTGQGASLDGGVC